MNTLLREQAGGRLAARRAGSLQVRQMRPVAAAQTSDVLTDTRQQQKAKILKRVEPLGRGVNASQQDKEEVATMVQKLEGLNPTLKPLESSYLSGKWRLVYTTSSSILGTSKPWFLRPSGPIYQTIDVEKLNVRNRETWPFFNKVTALLTPLSENKVAVKFMYFSLLGLIPIPAPESARGELAITYLDDSMRVSRGDKGNMFVLVMDDAQARL